VSWLSYFGLKLFDLHELIMKQSSVVCAALCILVQCLFLNCLLPIKHVKINLNLYPNLIHQMDE